MVSCGNYDCSCMDWLRDRHEHNQHISELVEEWAQARRRFKQALAAWETPDMLTELYSDLVKLEDHLEKASLE